MTVGKLFEKKPLACILAIVVISALAVISQSGPHLDTPAAVPGAVSSGLPQDDATLPSFESPYFEPYRSRLGEAIADSPVTRSVRRPRDDELSPRTYLPLVARSGPISYYVSKTGSNADGKSWATAWNELDQIEWHVIQPGEIILLDGGATEMIYTTTLTVGKNGTSEKPITITLASEPGRDGRAVIFGGRSTPLPYCGQTDYTYETDGVRDVGISIGDYSWVVIDGRKWHGITIHGHNVNGIWLDPNSSHITVRNVEIYDNGKAYQSGGGWEPDLPGVDLMGTDITFERAIIHDNGQDAFQGGFVGDFTLRQSWLYNCRKHPIWDESFNYCTHTDGIQIYDGGPQSGFLIEETIIGPGFMQGVILGQQPGPGGPEAVVNDVTFRNVLFMKANTTNILGYPNTKPEGWVIDHVTVHSPNAWGHALSLEGSGHTVKDSIFHSGGIYLPDGLDSYIGNCQWNTEGFQLGQIADPLFVDVDDNAPFSLDDYALAPDSPCAGKGSSLTSVAQLLAQPDPDRVLPGLSWEAEEGHISAPFAMQDGYVSQPIETDDPALGVRASYRFTITTPGDYVVKALLDAPDSGSNSVFIDIDSEPTSPTLIWDIEITDGFQERIASWRGSGTPDANEFVPKVFTLSAGEHRLIIRGREMDIRLDRISVEPFSQ